MRYQGENCIRLVFGVRATGRNKRFGNPRFCIQGRTLSLICYYFALQEILLSSNCIRFIYFFGREISKLIDCYNKP